MNDVQKNKSEKDLSCRKLKEQLDALERETTAKLSEVERYNRDAKVRLSYISLINLTMTARVWHFLKTPLKVTG